MAGVHGEVGGADGLAAGGLAAGGLAAGGLAALGTGARAMADAIDLTLFK